MSSDTVYKAGILTVSDRASKEASFDKSGPFLKEFLEKHNYSIEKQTIVPDELHDIQKVVEQWTELKLELIVITGGTGFSKRDKTPEAVKPLLTRETPGITHLLLSSSISITPFAALSRPVTGIRDNTLIVTLPGSLKACKENMEAIIKVLPHGLDLLLNKDVTKTHEKIQSSGHHHKGGHNCIHKHDEVGHPSQTGHTVPLGTPVSGRARSSPYALIPVNQAQDIVCNQAQQLNTVTMPISQFLPSYVLAEDVKSTEPVPAYRASIVDGYAVYAEDGPGTYSIESVSLAGSNKTILTKGRIARVATGGMVPDGADAVVMLEDTKLISSNNSTGEEIDIEILVPVTKGENIREIGSDCAIGEIIGVEGQRISTVGGDLGALVAGGTRHVKVFRKPRVGVLSTGNEVVEPLTASQLKPGQIRDTNRLTILSAIQTAGFEPVDLGIIEDNVEKLEEGLTEALEQIDVLITTGGVSMGESDFMKQILEQKLGATIHFGRVLMKPGKPTTFATIPQGKRPPKLIFALPGNPVSAIVTFHLFVVSALKKMAGYSKYENVIVPVKLTHSIRLDARPEYHRVQIIVSLTEGLTATSTGNQQSSRLLSMLEANGLLQLPQRTAEKNEIKAGEVVPFSPSFPFFSFLFVFYYHYFLHLLSYYTHTILFKLSQNARKEGYGPGGIFEIPKLKPFNGAKHCAECGVVFNLFKQKYHCRNCGSVVCSNCSDNRISLKKFGYDNPVRCCDNCCKLIKMQNMNSNELSELTTKDLKEYINAYHLPAKTVIEKGDLVRIIFNTKPIANANEVFYRNHKHKSPVQQQQPDKSFFSNMMDDLFGSSQEPQQQQQQQQRPQQSRSSQTQRQQQQQRQSYRPPPTQQQQYTPRPQQSRSYQTNNTTNYNNNTYNNTTTYNFSSPSPQRPQQPPQQPSQQPQPRNQQQQQTSPKPKSPSPDGVLSIHDIVSAKIDPSSLSVRTLKAILKANFVEQSHVIEKTELVKLVQRLIDQHKTEDKSENVNDDSLCRICLDAQQNCVFLDCGHMVTCMDCAKKLIEQKNECPICREPILKLVHVFRS